MKIDIKPLSVNEAWQGKRFKTPKYKGFEIELLAKLRLFKLPEPPFKVTYTFGFSNKCSDYDNAIKQFQDCLCKKYKFNDFEIYEAHIFKKIVPKGQEYIEFEITSL